MASSSQHKFGAVPEIVYGTTPTTPAFQLYGITGTTLAITKGTIESERISPDRQVKDVRAGNRQCGGDISTELAYGAFDLFLQALLGGTWASNILKPGTTRRSFSVLRQFTDLGSSAKPNHIFKGVEFNTLALTIAPEAITKAVFGVMGQNMVILDDAGLPAGITYPTENANRAFDSFTGSITVNGNAVATITEITLNIDNGMEPRFVVFKDTTNQPKQGKVRVTGQLTLYFETSDLLEAFLGAETREVVFTITDLDGNSYVFTLPKCFPTGGQVDVSGEDDVTIPWPFSAIYDATEDTALSIERVPV